MIFLRLILIIPVLLFCGLGLFFNLLHMCLDWVNRSVISGALSLIPVAITILILWPLEQLENFCFWVFSNLAGDKPAGPPPPALR